MDNKLIGTEKNIVFYEDEVSKITIADAELEKKLTCSILEQVQKEGNRNTIEFLGI